MARRDSVIVISTGTIRRVVLVLVLAALLALVAAYGRQFLQRGMGFAEQVDRSASQAVFLPGPLLIRGNPLPVLPKAKAAK